MHVASFRANRLELGLPLQSLQIMTERDRTTEREEQAVITLPCRSFSPTVLWGTNCARPEQPQDEHSCVKDESSAWEPRCKTSVVKRAEREKLGDNEGSLGDFMENHSSRQDILIWPKCSMSCTVCKLCKICSATEHLQQYVMKKQEKVCFILTIFKTEVASKPDQRLANETSLLTKNGSDKRCT